MAVVDLGPSVNPSAYTYWIEAAVAPCGHSRSLVKPVNRSPWPGRSVPPAGSVITNCVTGTGPLVAVSVATVDCPAVTAVTPNALVRPTVGGSRRMGTVEVAWTTGLLDGPEVTRTAARLVTVTVVL